jgi:hypothetical protein
MFNPMAQPVSVSHYLDFGQTRHALSGGFFEIALIIGQ